MVAKVNGAIAAGSFIGHDIDHWSIQGLDMTSAAVATAFFDLVETKATVVIIGALGDGTSSSKRSNGVDSGKIRSAI